MMWHCENCGMNHYYDEVVVERDPDTLEHSVSCPNCGGDLVEAVPCEVCGEYHTLDELFGYDHRVCKECIDTKEHDIDFCVEIGQTSGTEFVLNEYLSRFFTAEELEELMLNEVKKRMQIRPFSNREYLYENANDAADIMVESC